MDFNEMSVGDEMLYFMASCGFVSRKYLVAIGSNDSYPYRAIQRLVNLGYVEMRTFKFKGKYRARTETYYGITRGGMQYLAAQADNFPEDLRWVKELYHAVLAAEIKKDKVASHQNTMLRFLSVSGATVISALAGIRVSAVSVPNISELDEYDEDVYSVELDGEDNVWPDEDAIKMSEAPAQDESASRVTLGELVAETLSGNAGTEQNHNGIIGNADSDVIFANAYSIKSRMLREEIESGTSHAGRFTGVLESPLKTVLLYEGKRDGMSWSRWIVKTDLRPYHMYAKRFSEYRSYRTGEDHGAILVSNPKMFEDLFFDKHSRWKQGEKFGGGFTSFTVFPINRMGVDQLMDYMSTDISEHNRQLVDAALSSGIYALNKEIYKDAFPLKNQDGVQMAIGVFMDVVQIQKIHAIQKVRAFPFGVICYEWQREYYCRVLPDDAHFMTVR